MVNLESAITERGTWDPKDLERPDERYWFRAPARALDVLADAGVDVVTVANNHGADLGPTGLQDTLRAARNAPLAVVGVGQDRAHAFAPYRVRVHGTDLAFLAADASPLESTSSTWTAGRRTPGLAAARGPRPRALLHAVRRADRDADVVVVYLHWGRDMQACPTARQRTTAHALAAAGADVIVGSHAHVLLGSGWQRGHLHQLRPGELRLVPQPPPGDRGAAAAADGRQGRLRPVDAGPDRAAGRSPSPALGRCDGSGRSPTGRSRRGCAGLDSAAAAPARRGSRRRSSGSRRSFVSGCAAAITPAVRCRGEGCATSG